MIERHGPGNMEHTLCGLAPDAFESGDWDELVEIAQPGERATCEMCCNLIDWVRGSYRGYTLKKEKP